MVGVVPRWIEPEGQGRKWIFVEFGKREGKKENSNKILLNFAVEAGEKRVKGVGDGEHKKNTKQIREKMNIYVFQT